MLCPLHNLRLDITNDGECPLCKMEVKALKDAGYDNSDIAEWRRSLIENKENGNEN